MAGTFLLPHGYYVVGYVKDGDRAKAFAPWVQANQRSITIIENADFPDERIVGFRVDADTDYPIDGPFLYEATATTAKDPVDTWLTSTTHDTAQYAALQDMQAGDAKDAMAAAITVGELADKTAKNVVSDEQEKEAGWWSGLPMTVKGGIIVGGGLGAYFLVRELLGK